MSVITGLLLLACTAGAWIFFSPKLRGARLSCGVCALMGVISLLSGPGNWLFMLLQGALALTAAVCCLLECRRESVLRRRAKKKAACRTGAKAPGGVCAA